MQFVDKQDDFALRVFDFLEHGLQTVFEFAAILCAGQHRSQIERYDTLVLQNFGYVAGDDTLREAFNDCGLADSGLADQHRIILCASRKYLHDAANFLIASDDRVEFAATRLLVQIAGITFERLVFSLGILIGDALRPSDSGEGFQDRVVRGAVTRQQFLR